MKRNHTGVICGIILLAAGGFAAAQALGIWDGEIFFDGWWTLFLIVPCIVSIITNGIRAFSTCGLVLGILMLLSAQDILYWGTVRTLFFPLVLVAVGVSLLTKTLNKTAKKAKTIKQNHSKLADYTAIFSSNQQRFNGRPFVGGEANAIFGSVLLDLRGAMIMEDVVIEANAIFGSVEILTDEHVKVCVSSTPIFGGVSNRARDCMLPNAPTIYINAVSVFGSTDIKTKA